MNPVVLVWLPWVLLLAALGLGSAFHRRQQRQLANTQIMLRRISQAVESTSDAIGIGDMAGNSLYHNRAHLELFGYTVAELNAVPETGVLFADPEIAQQILHAVKQGRSWRGEADIRTKTGRQVPAFVRADIIRDDTGRPVGIYGVFADISEERQRQAEAARAGKLESLGLLAGGVAHDFSNLLTAMAGNLMLVRLEPGLSIRAQDYLQQIGEVVTRASKLTQGLKTYAKGGTPERHHLTLTHLIRETAALAVQGAPVELDCRVPDHLPPVEADGSQLGQVFHNIILNAAQAMPTGGRITLTTTLLSEGQDPAVREGQRWIKVAIADNGPGISADKLPKIFDPFFTTKATGTGLGLATAYSVIEQHGGRLRVESTVGRGTTFYVLLPTVAAAEESARAETAVLVGQS